MDKWTFGLTMMVVGIGGTFLTLGVLSVVMGLLKKAFPLRGEDTSAEKKSRSAN